MQAMYDATELASMDPLVLMKNLDHCRMTSRRLSYILQQQVHLYTPEANQLREQIDTWESVFPGDVEVRAFDRGASTVAATLDAVMDYHQFLVRGDGTGAEQQDKGLDKTAALVKGMVDAVKIPITAKMRLGFEHADDAETCAQALADGGAASIVVHARTKLDGYKPPAYWERIGGIRDAVKVPVFANGEVWSVADWRRCRAVSGVDDVMLGRGMIARPDLARQIAAVRDGREITPMGWAEIQPLVQRYWDIVVAGVATPRYAPGLLKQWLVWLGRSYPEAAQLFLDVRSISDTDEVERRLKATASPPL